MLEPAHPDECVRTPTHLGAVALAGLVRLPVMFRVPHLLLLLLGLCVMVLRPMAERDQ
jgi:hypothetical protein